MTAPVFFNSAFVRKPKKMVLSGASWGSYSFPVRWGFMQQSALGPIVIDCGYSSDVTEGKDRSFALKLYSRFLRPQLLQEGQITQALSQFSIKPEDVPVVIITHFHADHVAALKKFTNALFFVSRAAIEELENSSQWRLWHKAIFNELLPADFKQRLRFIEDCPQIKCEGYQTYNLCGDGSLLALPLPGHATGHFGLIWPKLAKPLLYAVDTEWLAEALPPGRKTSLGARIICADLTAAKESKAAANNFIQHGFDLVLCHDIMTATYDR